MTVGAGYLGNQMRQPGGFEFEDLPLAGATTDSISGSVLSTEEADSSSTRSTPARRSSASVSGIRS